MKEQYIKQVEKELSLTRKAKKEVVRDLNEVFASALEHGETEQQVIERLGTPKEFAENTAEQLGIDSAAPQKRKGIISSVAALVVAVAAFVIYATTQSGKVPDGAIGQADAMTNIQVEGAFGFDASQIILAVGVIAVTIAIIQIIRTVRKTGGSYEKFVSIIAILLMLSLAACSNQDTPSAADNPSNTQTESNTMLDAGVWPVNEYTEGLPVPSGTVGWAMLDTEHENCSISIVDISETDYNDYLELLKQEGFSIIEEVSEEIEGQDYVSIGTLLSNGEKGLSISYIPDNFTIYISFLK